MPEATTKSSIRLILTDIEGTTSSIAFVKQVLFPYAAQHMDTYVRRNAQQPSIRALLDDVIAQAKQMGNTIAHDDLDGITRQLLDWISSDTKATPLKALQGKIWQAGYTNGDYQAHMYPDASTVLHQWKQRGLPIYVYSSGSVAAQKLFFQYSDHGDLRSLFQGHFDTQIGHKQHTESYYNILKQLQQNYPQLQPQHILFLSDIEAELEAAEANGMQTAWLQRPEDVSAAYQVSAGAHQRPSYSDFYSLLQAFNLEE